MKENKCIVADILHYKEMDDILYLINKNTYTILKYQEEKYKQSSSLTDFTLEEQQIFQEVKYSPSQNRKMLLFLEDSLLNQVQYSDNNPLNNLSYSRFN